MSTDKQNDQRPSEVDILTKALSNIQRIDPCATKVLKRATHTALYSFQHDKKAWVKTEVDGPFFVYERCDKPFYSVMIANRQSPEDFIEPLIPTMNIQGNENYMYTKKDDGAIKCIWFYRLDEREAVTTLVDKLISQLKEGKVPSPTPDKCGSPVPVPPPVESNNLLELLKNAQRSNSNKERSSSGSSGAKEKVEKPAEKVASQSVTEMPTLLQKLMVQEQPQMFSRPVPTSAMMSADELEKDLVADLLTTAKPKLNAINDIAHSSSAVSLANLSTRSVHGSEEDAEVESVVSNRVPAEDLAFVVGSGSGSTSPTLNKDQFLSALSHLLETDDVFVAQLHQAYADAINRRLKLTTDSQR